MLSAADLVTDLSSLCFEVLKILAALGASVVPNLKLVEAAVVVVGAVKMYPIFHCY